MTPSEGNKRPAHRNNLDTKAVACANNDGCDLLRVNFNGTGEARAHKLSHELATTNGQTYKRNGEKLLYHLRR